jgi:lactoylglutathione lyase
MKTKARLTIALALLLASYTIKAQPKPGDTEVRLNHIGVYVSDLKTSTTFYETILNLKQIPEPFHDGRHTWFTIGAAGHLHLIQGIGEKKTFERDRNDHLCFSVGNMDAFIANLDKNHVEYTNFPGTAKEPTVRPDGVKQIYFKDPDGHLIEINNDASVK